MSKISYHENITPIEYELQVKKYIETYQIDACQFRVKHHEQLLSHDGDYEIDITARFQLLGTEWLVLIECKRYAEAVERKVVLELETKRQVLRAQKAMIFSTSGFQSGAVAFAHEYKIDLIKLYKNEVIRFGETLQRRDEYFFYWYRGMDAKGKPDMLRTYSLYEVFTQAAWDSRI